MTLNDLLKQAIEVYKLMEKDRYFHSFRFSDLFYLEEISRANHPNTMTGNRAILMDLTTLSQKISAISIQLKNIVSLLVVCAKVRCGEQASIDNIIDELISFKPQSLTIYQLPSDQFIRDAYKTLLEQAHQFIFATLYETRKDDLPPPEELNKLIELYQSQKEFDIRHQRLEKALQNSLKQADPTHMGDFLIELKTCTDQYQQFLPAYDLLFRPSSSNSETTDFGDLEAAIKTASDNIRTFFQLKSKPQTSLEIPKLKADFSEEIIKRAENLQKGIVKQLTIHSRFIRDTLIKSKDSKLDSSVTP